MNYCFIGFGKLYNLHLYIIYFLICKYLSNFLFSFNSIKKVDYGIFHFIPILYNHSMIYNLYMYIGYIIFSSIFLYIFKHKKDLRDTLIENVPSYEFKSLNKTITFKSENYGKEIIIISLLYVFYKESYNISYCFSLSDFDFWIFNIFFILYFMEIYFKIKHYKHQLYSLTFVFVINLIILYMSTFINTENENSYVYIKKLFKTKYFSIFLFLVFAFDSCILSFSRVKSKVLMENKYISPHKIIFMIGCLGFVVCLFSLFIASSFSCKGRIKTKCYVKYLKNINKDKVYLDNIYAYFSNLNYQMKNEKSKFWIEVIIITPLHCFLEFLKFNYEFSMIYYLNPIYILVCDSLNYGIKCFFSSLFNFNFNTKKILAILADVFSILGYLIYVEVLELRFCGLNEKTKRILELKGKNEILFEFKDLNPIFIEEDDDNDDDNDLNKENK